MRFVAVMLVCLSVPAVARTEIIEEPPPAGGCQSGATWEIIEQCLRKASYAVAPIKSAADWHLVSLAVVREPSGHARRDRSLALYVKKKTMWQLGGMLGFGDADYEVLAADRVTIGKRVGWKLDVGFAQRTLVTTSDTQSTVWGLARYNRTAYCNGESAWCTDMFTSCEVLVHGKAWFAFRGRPTLVDNDTAVEVRGDRSRAGNSCVIPLKHFINFK